MWLTLNRIGSTLFGAKAVSNPILNVNFLRQHRKRSALREITMQELMLPIFEAAKKQPLKIKRSLRRELECRFKRSRLSRRPRRCLRVLLGAFVRQRTQAGRWDRKSLLLA
jgi:hypothetical protein